MAKHKLTKRQFENLSEPGMYGDGGGLYLKIAPGGSRQWVFRYRRPEVISGESRSRYMGLGSAEKVSLAEARELAEKAGAVLKTGSDPLVEKEASKITTLKALRAREERLTFRQAAEAYIEHHKPSWKNAKHAEQWPSTMDRYVYPILGDMAVADVTTADVLKVLSPIWLTKRETASRVRGRIEAILGRATALGQRQGPNPASLKNNLEHVLADQKRAQQIEHHAAMTWRDVPALMARLRSEMTMGALALRFCVLCATRTNEVIGATWGEIDLKAKTWTIPKARMKKAREHVIPLSDAALEVLQQAEKHRAFKNDHVFPGEREGKGISNMTMLNAVKRFGLDVTVHGFRSAFRDFAFDATDAAFEVAEMCLAHIVGDSTQRAYLRTNAMVKRAELMAAWGVHCSQEVEPLQVKERRSKRPPRGTGRRAVAAQRAASRQAKAVSPQTRG